MKEHRVKRVLITGSNRGFGLEFVRQYCEDGWRVYAACRHPTDAVELRQLAEIFSELSLHRLDVTIAEDIVGLCSELADIPLDLLLGNVAISSLDTDDPWLGAIRYDDWERTLKINTLGTVRIVEVLLDRLAHNQPGSVVAIVNNSAQTASPDEQAIRLYHDSSMAALNYAVNSLKTELSHLGIGVVLLDPGQFATRSGKSGDISVHRRVAGMREAIAGFKPEQSGMVIRYDGVIREPSGIKQ